MNEIKKRVPSLKFKLSEDDLNCMESNEMECNTAVLLPYQPFALSKAEWCYITRVRAGKTLEQVAKSMRLHPSYVVEVEEGNGGSELTDKLVEFWEKRAKQAKARKAARRRTATV